MTLTRARARRARLHGVAFDVSCGAIAANKYIIVDFSEDPIYGRYAPFDSVTIFNNSDSLIDVYVNQNEEKKIPIASKTEKAVTAIYVHDLKIKEMSGLAVTAGDVRLYIERLPQEEESFVRRLQRALPIGGW